MASVDNSVVSTAQVARKEANTFFCWRETSPRDKAIARLLTVVIFALDELVTAHGN